MGINLRYEICNSDKYKIYNLEVYAKGDLKGYAQGMIEFSNERLHEFLYRVHDPNNGKSNTLVSIDYGFSNPMVGELWDEIESNIKDAVVKLKIVGRKEDLDSLKWLYADLDEKIDMC